MRTVEYSGTLHALTSLANTGKENGTTHLFRSEALLMPDGRFVPAVPVMSGSVIRGSLRRVAAAMTQHALNQVLPADDADGRLPLAVVHAMRTGGALRETRNSKDVLTGEKQSLLRDMIPMFGVFGLSAGGRIMSGRLMVDKAVPVARETMHLLEHYDIDGALEGYQPPSIWQLLQRERYSRFADVNDAAASSSVAPSLDAADTPLPRGSGTMLWGEETLVAGTRLLHSLVAEAVTPVEVSFLDDLLGVWSADARIGGQRARGMGRVRCEYTRTCKNLLGQDCDDEESAPWRVAMERNADRLPEVLSWLA